MKQRCVNCKHARLNVYGTGFVCKKTKTATSLTDDCEKWQPWQPKSSVPASPSESSPNKAHYKVSRGL